MECANKNDYLNSKLQQIHNHVVRETIDVEFEEDYEQDLVNQDSYIEPEQGRYYFFVAVFVNRNDKSAVQKAFAIQKY